MYKIRKIVKELLPCLAICFFVSCNSEDQSISHIQISNTELSIRVNKTYKLTVSYSPSSLASPNFFWRSSNESIVTVNSIGELVTRKVGEAYITVSALGDKFSDSCKVIVLPINSTSISLSSDSLELYVGQENYLTFNILPENTTFKQVNWTASNMSVATVDNGKVKGVSPGLTWIVVTTKDNISDSCYLNVKPVRVTSIEMSKTNLSLELTDSELLNVDFFPSNATNKKIIWSSSDSRIADVSNGVVVAKKEGDAVITAKSDDGGYISTCSVNVKLKGLVLSKSNLNVLPNEQILIHVLYSTSNEAYLNASWVSSNPSAATVTSDGAGTNSALIKTKSVGSAHIYAYSEDGLKNSACIINVKSIKEFMSLKTIGSGLVIINGFVTGDMYSQITNNSTQSIVLTSFYIYDGYTGSLVAYSTNPTSLGELKSGEIKNLGTKLNSIYKPIFVWTFNWDGNSYTVQHQYQSSLYGVAKKTEKLNLIK